MKRGKFWFVPQINLSHNFFFSTAFTFGLLIALLSIITRQGDGQESSTGDPILKSLEPFLIGILSLVGLGDNSNSIGTENIDGTSAAQLPSIPLLDLLKPLLDQLFNNIPEPVLEEATCGCTSFLLASVFDPIRAILGPLDALTAPLAVPLNALAPFLTPLTETINNLAPLAKVLGPLLCALKPVIDILASGILLLVGPLLPVLIGLAMVVITLLSSLLMLLVLVARILEPAILAPLVKGLVTILVGLLSVVDPQQLIDSISNQQ